MKQNFDNIYDVNRADKNVHDKKCAGVKVRGSHAATSASRALSFGPSLIGPPCAESQHHAA
jgi:hypothetical protein